VVPLAEEDINLITKTYNNQRGLTPALSKGEGVYKDIKGFCKSATIEEIEKHNHVLTPGRYVGIEAVEDDGISFETKMEALTTTLKQQMDKEAQLNNEIAAQLAKIGLEL
jgi:type I restriction enzyme M protein